MPNCWIGSSRFDRLPVRLRKANLGSSQATRCHSECTVCAPCRVRPSAPKYRLVMVVAPLPDARPTASCKVTTTCLGGGCSTMRKMRGRLCHGASEVSVKSWPLAVRGLKLLWRKPELSSSSCPLLPPLQSRPFCLGPPTVHHFSKRREILGGQRVLLCLILRPLSLAATPLLWLLWNPTTGPHGRVSTTGPSVKDSAMSSDQPAAVIRSEDVFLGMDVFCRQRGCLRRRP